MPHPRRPQIPRQTPGAAPGTLADRLDQLQETLDALEALLWRLVCLAPPRTDHYGLGRRGSPGHPPEEG